MPSRAVAIPRNSSTSQSAPTPRQSHWNTSEASRTDAASVCGVSLWFWPSVSRIACRWVADGTEPNSRVASRSHEPIAVPPPAASRATACLAACLAPGSISTMAERAFGNGKRRSAPSVPAITANQVPSRIWSMAAAAATRAALILSPAIDPEVSMMTISAASPSDPRPASPAPAQVTVTMACTSVPPSGRNSFW